MATAKGLAQGAGIKLITVPTLDSLAENLWGVSGLICPILNAKKNEVYSAVYRFNGERMERLSEYLAIAPEDLITEIKKNSENIYFLGDGVPIYREKLVQDLGNRAKFAKADKMLNSGSALAILGYEKALKGEFAELYTAEPIYIRKCEAQIRWEAAHPGECVL